jgi:hypothetical protein
MYDLPQNTMMTYGANPMFDALNFSELPVSKLAEEIEAFKKKSKGHMVAPESDALTFYFMNHAFHVMKSRFNPLERLDPDLAQVAEQHIKSTNEVAKRLLFYSMVIAVEEARFIPQQDARFFNFLENSYGYQFKQYVKDGFKGSLTDFGKLDMTCGQFTTGMMSVFAFGRWQPGFGGRGWTPIAALVADCVSGNISFEGMADQAFSLCHNNGSMFNKGHLYSCYSQFIYNILDIQDSGQVPQWIASNRGSKFITPDLARAFEIMAKRFPDEMTGSVDMKLIKNSEAKREQKAAALAKKNAAMWNQTQLPEDDKPQGDARNNVLMSGMDIFTRSLRR